MTMTLILQRRMLGVPIKPFQEWHDVHSSAVDARVKTVKDFCKWIDEHETDTIQYRLIRRTDIVLVSEKKSVQIS